MKEFGDWFKDLAEETRKSLEKDKEAKNDTTDALKAPVFDIIKKYKIRLLERAIRLKYNPVGCFMDVKDIGAMVLEYTSYQEYIEDFNKNNAHLSSVEFLEMKLKQLKKK